MNVANQTFWIEVVEVGCPHHTAHIPFCGGEQEDTRFPAATKASTAEFLDHLLP